MLCGLKWKRSYLLDAQWWCSLGLSNSQAVCNPRGVKLWLGYCSPSLQLLLLPGSLGSPLPPPTSVSCLCPWGGTRQLAGPGSLQLGIHMAQFVGVGRRILVAWFGRDHCGPQPWWSWTALNVVHVVREVWKSLSLQQSCLIQITPCILEIVFFKGNGDKMGKHALGQGFDIPFGYYWKY